MYFFIVLTAKLHALLNTNSIPAHPIKHSPAPIWEQTDESLSEDSRYNFILYLVTHKCIFLIYVLLGVQLQSRHNLSSHHLLINSLIIRLHD